MQQLVRELPCFTCVDFSALVAKTVPSQLGHYTLVVVDAGLINNEPIRKELSRGYVSHHRHSIVASKSKGAYKVMLKYRIVGNIDSSLILRCGQSINNNTNLNLAVLVLLACCMHFVTYWCAYV